MYGTRFVNSGISLPTPLFLPDGRLYDFTILYDPEGNSGNGSLRVTLDNQVGTLLLPSGRKEENASLDRFGICNMQDNNGKYSIVYLDDLYYTAADDTDPNPNTSSWLVR
jgi:hypothetical protein